MHVLCVAAALIGALAPARGQTGTQDSWKRAVDAAVRDASRSDPARSSRAIDDLSWVVQHFTEPLAAGAELTDDELRGALLAAIELARIARNGRPVGAAPLELLAIAREAARRYGGAEYRANIEHRIAIEEHDLGRFALARSVLEDALEEIPDARGMRPFLEIELAELCRYAGDFRAAGAWLDEASCHLIPDFARHDLARCSIAGLRAQIALDLGLPDRAAIWLAEERARSDALKDGDARVAAFQRRARFDLSTENFDKVVRDVESAIDTEPVKSASPAVRAQIVLLLGRALLGRGRDDARSLARAEAILESLVASRFLREPDRADAEITLARVKMASGCPESARSHLESARARLARENDEDPLVHAAKRAVVCALDARLALDGSSAYRVLAAHRFSLDDAWYALAAHWERTPQRSGGVGWMHYSRRRLVVSERIALDVRLDGPEAGLRAVLEAEALGGLARRLSSAPGASSIDLRDVRAALAPGSAGAIVYFPAPDRSHAFAIDARGVAYFELGPDGPIETLRQELIEHLASTDRREAEHDPARALCAALVPEALRQRIESWSALTVVGSESLGNLPFEWFRFGEQPPLGVAVPITHVPSLAVAVLLARRMARERGGPTIDLRIVAAPLRSDPPLMFGGAEARSLTRAFVRGRTQVWAGEDASRSALLADRTRALVWSLVAHGVYDATRERPAGIRLEPSAGDDGVLRSEDIETLAAPPRIAILGTCGAARGPLRRGDDGVGGIAGAFLCAGSDAVVLSSFDVEYGEMLALLAIVHDELAKGASPAAALQRAREMGWSRGESAALLMQSVGLGHAARVRTGAR